MTSYLTLNISQTEMTNIFDNSDLNIRDYRKYGNEFYIEIRHNSEKDGKSLVIEELYRLGIKTIINDYQIPELCKRCW